MSPAPSAPVVPTRGRIRPLGLEHVRITGGFWGRRQEVNGANTLPHIRHWLEREGWIANFDLAASGTLPQGRRGREFSDSEVYKYLEAIAWESARVDDPSRLEEEFSSVAARVARAQEADGYLNTRFGRPGQGARWSDLQWGHELYCLGHLFQAAVARIRTRPDAADGLADVARRAADLVCSVFGVGGIESVCGHPEVETALAELSRATGEPRYLQQARLFVERRGTGTLGDIEWGREYFQDDMPVRKATALRGHAVRANYLASGAVDVAVDTDDAELLDALTAQWSTTVARRTYITGGQGSHHQDEAFGADWELPPDRAYSETCAGVASVQFSWRMLLAGGGPEYADLIERTLYNVVATSPDADGRSFYYANTLHQRLPGQPADPTTASARASSSLRAPWFDVSCCPPNVARTLASLATLIATIDDDGVQLHQYAPSRISTALVDGTPVELDIETAYPDDGVVRVTVAADAELSVSLRVPNWAVGATIAVAGQSPTSAALGTVTVRRRFRTGDVIELTLPTAPRIVRPDDRIDAIRGTLAVERGPEVLCLESIDAADRGLGPDVGSLRLDPSVLPRLHGAHVVAQVRSTDSADAEWPYGAPPLAAPSAAADVILIPYHRWAERGPSTMRIWIPVD